MMQAAAYGRLGNDPRPITTKTGKPMTVASMAVSIDDSDTPLWLGIVAFGTTAEQLLKNVKGDMISVSGRLQRNVWTDKEGNQKEQLQIVADAVISARTVRPGRKLRPAGVVSETLFGAQP